MPSAGRGASRGSRRALCRGGQPRPDRDDERASVAPVLAGSKIVLAMTLNKPMPHRSPAEAFGEDASADMSIEGEGSLWRVSWTAGRSVRLPTRLRDEHGIANALESAYQFTVVDDQVSGATVLDPAQDESVTAAATLEVVSKGATT